MKKLGPWRVVAPAQRPYLLTLDLKPLARGTGATTMFDLFKLITDSIREQTEEYSKAQDRVGARQISALFDPFGMTTTSPVRVAIRSDEGPRGRTAKRTS